MSGAQDDVEQWRQGLAAKGVRGHARVGVDIGGTWVRVVVHAAGAATPVEFAHVVRLPAGTRERLLASLAAAVKVLEACEITPTGVCVAYCGPVEDNAGATDQYGLLKLTELPALLCPAGASEMINDLVACSRGIVALDALGRLGEYFSTAWTPDGVAEAGTPAAALLAHNHLVVCLGTGLGNAVLLSQGGARFQVLPIEAGLTTVTAMVDEAPFLAWMRKRLQDEAHDVEWEEICSGRGLEACYAWKAGKQAPSAREIAQRASANEDEDAVAALLLQFKILMRYCQNIAGALLCRTVVLAGDNHAFNSAFFARHAKELRGIFVDHTMERSPHHWMSRFTLVHQVRSVNFNLLGVIG